uniref:Esterase n=1 Tax=Ctenocephalides felis TaxID=7515 RepID=I3VPE6_CTEFE
MKYVDLMGDAWFNYGVFKTLKSIINTNRRKENTYFYKLSDSSYSVYKTYIITKYSDLPGVCHADDLGYLFRVYGDSRGFIKLTIPKEGMLTHQRLVKMWSNFAKTGNPLQEKANGGNALEKKKGDDPLSKVTWEKVDKGNIKYLDITEDEELKMKQFQEVEGQRFNLWDKLYEIGQEIFKNKKPDTKL